MNIPTKYFEWWVKLFLYGAVILVPLIAFSSLYFPYTTTKAYAFRLFVELALLGWLPLLVVKKEFRDIFKSPVVLGVLGMFIVLLLTSFTGVDPVHSLFNRLERSDGVLQFGFWALFLVMALSVLRKRQDWEILLLLYIGTALASVIFGLLNGQWALRLPGTFGNPSFEGVFLLFAVGFAGLFLTDRFSLLRNAIGKTATTWLLWFLISFFLLAIILTQTRGLYLGIVGGFAVGTLLANIFLRDRLKRLLLIPNSLLVVLVIFFILIFSFPDSTLVSKYGIIRRIAQAPRTDSVTERLIEWRVALQGFADRPLLGWGPENFIVVSNKYYDYRVGLIDQWFDRPHNQFLQYLAEGGMVLFATYLAMLGAVFICLYKILRRDPVLGVVAGATFVGYLVQNAFLFDVLASYVGLFIFLGVVVFEYVRTSSGEVIEIRHEPMSRIGWGAFCLSVILVSFLVWQSVMIPYESNTYIRRLILAIGERNYSAAHALFKQALRFNSPYVFSDVRKYAGWEILVKGLQEDGIPIESQKLSVFYDDVMPELEAVLKKRPTDPQIYYVLGALYRLGYEKLGKEDGIQNAERVMRQAFAYSTMRIEYIDEMGQILVHQEKFDELNDLITEFLSHVGENDPYRFITLGHTYYLQDQFEKALEEYDKARALGSKFWDNDRDYYRYLQSAQAVGRFDKAAELIIAYLTNKQEDAENYFNLAVAYLKLGETERARDAFAIALSMDESYLEYESFFAR